jgi:hypothetical protein
MKTQNIILILLAVYSINFFIPQTVKSQPNCSSTYNPPKTVEERRSQGWFDGRIARAAFKNTSKELSASIMTITLYHPDAPSQPFAVYSILPQELKFLSQDNYVSDWGIQLGEGPICLLGKVSIWKIDSNNRPYFLSTPESLGRPTSLELVDTVMKYNANAIREQGRALARQGKRGDALKQLVLAANVFRVQGNKQQEAITLKEMAPLQGR